MGTLGGWDWPAGPKSVWGPIGWRWLHLAAIYYPRAPAAADAEDTAARIGAFVARLPCAECRWHAALHLRRDPPALGSSGAFRVWAWRFHNAVNARLGHRRVSYAECCRLYADDIRWADWAGGAAR
jgi:FAD-linked sulfhydryl oxidase